MHRTCTVIIALLAVGASGSACADDTSLIDQYLSVFDQNSADDLPLTDDASFDGALLDEPIIGRDNVIAFLNRVSPGVEFTQIVHRFETDKGACLEARVEFSGVDGTLEEAHCFDIEDGKIAAVRLYYDPRPLLGDSSN